VFLSQHQKRSSISNTYSTVAVSGVAGLVTVDDTTATQVIYSGSSVAERIIGTPTILRTTILRTTNLRTTNLRTTNPRRRPFYERPFSESDHSPNDQSPKTTNPRKTYCIMFQNFYTFSRIFSLCCT
jgi:hypothetical protein